MSYLETIISVLTSLKLIEHLDDPVTRTVYIKEMEPGRGSHGHGT